MANNPVANAVTHSLEMQNVRAQGMREVEMNQSFPVFLGFNKISEMIGELRKSEFDHVFLGYDEDTALRCGPHLEAELQRQGISYFTHVLGASESAQEIKSLDSILEAFLEGGGTRKTVIMPVGDHTASNTFGVAASLLFRGIRFVPFLTSFHPARRPTYPTHKGAEHGGDLQDLQPKDFVHPPSMAFVDTSFYPRIDAAELKEGLAELTQYGVLYGGSPCDFLKKTMLAKGWRLSPEELVGAKEMLLLLECERHKQDLAVLFDYGRPVGDALEKTEGMSLTRGESLAFGMLAASFIAHSMKIMSAEDRKVHDALVWALDPQVELPHRDLVDDVFSKVLHADQQGHYEKRAGFCRFVLARRIGDMHAPNSSRLEHVPEDLVRQERPYEGDLKCGKAWYTRST